MIPTCLKLAKDISTQVKNYLQGNVPRANNCPGYAGRLASTPAGAVGRLSASAPGMLRVLCVVPPQCPGFCFPRVLAGGPGAAPSPTHSWSLPTLSLSTSFPSLGPMAMSHARIIVRDRQDAQLRRARADPVTTPHSRIIVRDLTSAWLRHLFLHSPTRPRRGGDKVSLCLVMALILRPSTFLVRPALSAISWAFKLRHHPDLSSIPRRAGFGL